MQAVHPIPPHLSAAARAWDMLGPKWTLAIVEQLRDGPKRFVRLQRDLGCEIDADGQPVDGDAVGIDRVGISTEQLRSRLNRMIEDGLVTRTRYREVPPRVDYELTGKGLRAVAVVDAMGAWADGR